MDQRLTEPHERIALPITQHIDRDTSTKVAFENREGELGAQYWKSALSFLREIELAGLVPCPLYVTKRLIGLSHSFMKLPLSGGPFLLINNRREVVAAGLEP